MQEVGLLMGAAGSRRRPVVVTIFVRGTHPSAW